MVLWLLVAVAALLALGYVLGRRRNLALVTQVARDLEEALEPKDKTYTWIGGLIGFKASYELASEDWESVEATLVLLPRHAPLFLPFSYLLFRGDRLFLLGRLRGELSGELHLLGPDRRTRSRVLRERDLPVQGQADGYLLLASRPDLESVAEAFAARLRGWRIEHLAVVADRSTVFVLCRQTEDAGRAAGLLAAAPAILRAGGMLPK